MKPLILILAAGEGKRLHPLTEHTPKPFLDIGDKKLIDLVMEPLPDGIERVILLKKTRKFKEFERYMRDVYGFQDRSILYQDLLTGNPRLPRKIYLSTLFLAYYLGLFPSRNSRIIRQFDPVVIVPGDVIVKGLDYSELIDYHVKAGADVTMPVRRGIVEGSNSWFYVVRDGRFIAASKSSSLDGILTEGEIVQYAHEGTYVLGRRFFSLSVLMLLMKRQLLSPNSYELFQKFKVVPYQGNFQWIDVGTNYNLERAREAYRRRK